MDKGTLLPRIYSTMYIESHDEHLIAIKKLANQAFAENAPFSITELWQYIINTLAAKNGTGHRTALRLEEFQSQQWRRYKITPEACRDAWHSLSWPLTVPSPSLIR